MYYTPRLEEFHLGFECEILVDEKWQLCTLGYRKSRAAQLKGLIHAKTHGYSNTVTIDEDFRMSNLRVKWLEAHDIVDFGFSFT